MQALHLLTLTAALALAPFAAAQNVPQYDLETLGFANRVNEIGPSGHIVGWVLSGAFPQTRERAFVVEPGQQATQLLPLPAGHDRSVAWDVDASGLVCGSVAAIGNQLTLSQPVVWVPQPGGGYAVQFLTLPSGFLFGSAEALNEVGDIVGLAHIGSPFAETGVRYSIGGPATAFGATNTRGFVAVNDARVAIDRSLPAQVLDLATGAVSSLPVPPPGPTGTFQGVYVHELTNNGRVVGGARLFTLAAECAFHAAAFEPGAGWELNGTCGPSNAALDANEGGDTVDVLGSFLHVHLDGQTSVRIDNQIVSPPGTGPWLCQTSFGAAIDEERVIACVALNTANGISHLVRLTPRVTCQADLGFGGPGNGRLTVCGGDLSLGTTAELALIGATPSSIAYLGVSLVANPTPIFGGTAVPFPAQLLVPLPIDAAGVGRFAPVNGGFGPFSVYVQGAWVDASLPQFIGLSNAVRIDVLP